MKLKPLMLLLAASTTVAGVLYLNRGPKTEYHFARIAGVHPSTPGNYKDMAFVYLLDSLGNKKDSMNVEITPQVCKEYRIQYDEYGKQRLPNRLVVAEFEKGEIKAEGTDSTYTGLIKMTRAAPVANKEDLPLWGERIRKAKLEKRPEYLFGKAAER